MERKLLHSPLIQYFFKKTLSLPTPRNFVYYYAKRIRAHIKLMCVTSKIVAVCYLVHSSGKKQNRNPNKQKSPKVIWNEPSEQGGPLGVSGHRRKKAPIFSLPELVGRRFALAGLCRR